MCVERERLLKACMCTSCKLDAVQSVSSLYCSIGFGTIAELVATPILFVLAFAVAVSISIGIPVTCGNLREPTK